MHQTQNDKKRAYFEPCQEKKKCLFVFCDQIKLKSVCSAAEGALEFDIVTIGVIPRWPDMVYLPRGEFRRLCFS